MKKIAVFLIMAFAANSALAVENDPHVKKHPHGEFGTKLFAKQDTNNDGSITKDELDAHQKTSFNAVDANKDGKITLAEAKSAKRERGFNEISKGKKEVSLNDAIEVEHERFDSADTDHDGRITQDEFKSHYKDSFETKVAKK